MSSSKKRSSAAAVVDARAQVQSTEALPALVPPALVPPAPESSSVRLVPPDETRPNEAPANDIAPPTDLPAEAALADIAEPAPKLAAEPEFAAELQITAEPAAEPDTAAEPQAAAAPEPLEEEPASPVNYDDEGLGEVLIEGRIYRFDSGKQGSALCLSARQEGVWHWSYLGELRWDGRDLRSKRLDRQLLTQLSESLRQLATGS